MNIESLLIVTEQNNYFIQLEHTIIIKSKILYVTLSFNSMM